jgi:hypothetical protein
MKSMNKMGQINRTLTIHAISKERRLPMVKVTMQKTMILRDQVKMEKNKTKTSLRKMWRDS